METYLPLDLQLFAEETTAEETFEIEEEPSVELEVEEDEGEDEPETDEGATDENEQDRVPEQDIEENEEVLTKPNETGNAVIAERKKWQAKLAAVQQEADLTKKLMKQAGITDLEAFNRHLDSLEATHLENQGLDPEFAKAFVTQQRKLNDMEVSIKKQKFDLEVDKLKQNPLYADIEDFRDEYEAMAEKTGMTLQQIYWANHGPEQMKQMEKQIEQRLQNNLAKKQKAKVDTTEGGEKKTLPKFNLSADELEIAKAAKMSPQDYYKYKKK